MAKGKYQNKIAQNVEGFVKERTSENTVSEAIIDNTAGKEAIKDALYYEIVEEKKEEIRNKRMQIVIKPSLNRILDEMVKDGEIKSKNDLVNQLLERFVESRGYSL